MFFYLVIIKRNNIILKKRVDLLLVEKKFAESRNKAQAMIMAGQIFVDGKKILKSGDFIQENLEITIKNLAPKWVSRGAYKILHALKYFDIQVENLTCLDLGASTGGFSEVLLSEKVKKMLRDKRLAKLLIGGM